MFGGYLYFHKAPSKEEFHKETIDKLQVIHYPILSKILNFVTINSRYTNLIV